MGGVATTSIVLVSVRVSCAFMDGSEPVAGIDEFDLGGIYMIRYDANDTEVPPNSAIPQYRTVIVKDTLSPVISWNSIATYEVNSTSEFVKDINETRKHLLQNLFFTAEDENNFDQNLSYINAFSKWSVEFDPSFIERNDAEGQSGVYPLNRESSGYTVTVSVTDASGNQAEAKEFELKVGDYAAPEVSFIGDEIIHDFLRFKGNDSFPQERLFDDQDNSQLYDSTKVFQGGAHRLLLANYDFVDPGVWAEDESFPSNFPDVNPVGGNGKERVMQLGRQIRSVILKTLRKKESYTLTVLSMIITKVYLLIRTYSKLDSQVQIQHQPIQMLRGYLMLPEELMIPL